MRARVGWPSRTASLDEAVFAAYGWPSTLTDAELLERLLKLNHERAEQPKKRALLREANQFHEFVQARAYTRSPNSRDLTVCGVAALAEIDVAAML